MMQSNPTTATIRNTYYHLHDRGFANECSIIRCESDAERESAEAEGYERITRADLARHISYINAENAAWGSNRAFGRIRLVDVATSPEYAYGVARNY